METFSTLLAICAGKTGEFPAQRPVTWSFDVFFDLRLNKRLSKQLWGWWFETSSCPLWRQCNDGTRLLQHILWKTYEYWENFSWDPFLAATKQLYKWYFPSVCLSVCPSHLFDYVPIIGSSWNFQELLPMTNVRSMQKVKVRGQRSKSQRSQPNLTVSGL